MWLEQIISSLREHPTAIVGGTTINGLVGNWYAETGQVIIDLMYEHFNAGVDGACVFASNNVAVSRTSFMAGGEFDAAFRCAAEDREWCDRWRMMGRPLVWDQKAILDHRHAQGIVQFARIYWRYGRGAFRYHQLRRSRGSGTMVRDISFHLRLPHAVLRHVRRYPLRGRAAIVRNLCIWQLANAAGFLAAWVGDALPSAGHTANRLT
jgi:GT2 family glycosyltransferase